LLLDIALLLGEKVYVIYYIMTYTYSFNARQVKAKNQAMHEKSKQTVGDWKWIGTRHRRGYLITAAHQQMDD
jgi:hypothetical protein